MKRKLIKCLNVVVVTSIVVYSLMYVTQTQYLIKGFYSVYLQGRTTASIYDERFFDSRQIEATAIQTNLNQTLNQPTASKVSKISTQALDDYHTKYQSRAFLIFQKEKLITESYFDLHQATTRSNSFSIAKSVVSMLAFMAIEKGFFKLEDPVSQHLDIKISRTVKKAVRVGDLIRMSSGLDWQEAYKTPLNITSKSYLGSHVNETVLGQAFINEPGLGFEYLSGNTQLLAMILQKTTGESLSALLKNWLWMPIQAQDKAVWSLDKKNGMEKAFCCLHATARDFAKLGLLILQKGKYKDKQLLSPDSVSKLTSLVFSEAPHYGYGFWLDQYKGKDMIIFQGHLGQYIIVYPAKMLLIVRLGEQAGAFQKISASAFGDDTALTEAKFLLKETLEAL